MRFLTSTFWLVCFQVESDCCVKQVCQVQQLGLGAKFQNKRKNRRLKRRTGNFKLRSSKQKLTSCSSCCCCCCWLHLITGRLPWHVPVARPSCGACFSHKNIYDFSSFLFLFQQVHATPEAAFASIGPLFIGKPLTTSANGKKTQQMAAPTSENETVVNLYFASPFFFFPQIKLLLFRGRENK